MKIQKWIMFGLLKKRIMKDEILHKLSSVIYKSDIQGKKVLEVGARNVNGSVRPIIEALNPESYLGVDIQEGDGVDQICNIHSLAPVFGEASFAVVLCMETLEHVQYWQFAVSNLKAVLKPDGILIISMPVPGVKYHGYPNDFWRFRPKDIREIFRDMIILSMEEVRKSIVVKIQKPLKFQKLRMDHIRLPHVKN